LAQVCFTVCLDLQKKLEPHLQVMLTRQRMPRLHKKQPARAPMRCTILLLAAAATLAWAKASLGFSTGAGGTGGQQQRSKAQHQHRRQQQQQTQQMLQDPEQPSPFMDLRGVGVPMQSEVSEEQLAAVWRLPEKQLEQRPAATHAFWTRQKATPLRDQAAQRSALRLPKVHEQVKRVLRFHEDSVAREKAAKEEFDPDNTDHVATLLYRVFTIFVLWTGAMNAMTVWDPNL